MMRITTVLRHDGVVIKLEGRLAGPWVREAERAWQTVVQRGVPATLDLSEISYADAAGRELLGTVHAHGSRLSGARGFTRAIVDEIAANGRTASCGGGPCAGGNSTGE